MAQRGPGEGQGSDYLSSASADIQRLIFKELDRESIHCLESATSSFDEILHSHPINKIRLENMRLDLFKDLRSYSLSILPKSGKKLHECFPFTHKTYTVDMTSRKESITSCPQMEWDQGLLQLDEPTSVERFRAVLSKCLQKCAFSRCRVADVMCIDSGYIGNILSLLLCEGKIERLVIENCIQDMNESDRTRLRSLIDSSTIKMLEVHGTADWQPVFPLEWFAQSPLPSLSLLGPYRRQRSTASQELMEKIGKSVYFYVSGLHIPADRLASMMKARLQLQERGGWGFSITTEDDWTFDGLIRELNLPTEGFRADRQRGIVFGEYRLPLIRIVCEASGMIGTLSDIRNPNGDVNISFELLADSRYRLPPIE